MSNNNHSSQDDASVKDRTEDKTLPRTELELSHKLAEQQRGSCIWTDSIGYFRWDGSRWKEDLKGNALRLAADELCIRESGSAKRTIQRIAAVKHIAEHTGRLLQEDADLLDSRPELLACPEGTIDLTDAQLRESNPDDLLTRCAAVTPWTDEDEDGQDPSLPAFVVYNADRAPEWEKFLRRIQPDEEVRKYLQVMLGYGITGHTREHRFLFWYGSGRNGKSVLAEAVAGVLGDYAMTAGSETFMMQKYQQHTQELAVLRGARLVKAGEVRRGARWNEERVKMMTGGDTITARLMRGNNFQFQPAFMLCFHANHKPRLASVDVAMRRRIVLIPFDVEIPESEQDPKLQNKLMAEYPHILAWLAEGAREYLKTGLPEVPSSIAEATKSYLDSEDWLSALIDDCFERKGSIAEGTAAERLTLKQARQIADGWTRQEEMEDVKSRELKEALLARGFPYRKGHGVYRNKRVFHGLSPKQDAIDRADDEGIMQPSQPDDERDAAVQAALDVMGTRIPKVH